jgi:peptide/nickel transport system permease protein
MTDPKANSTTPTSNRAEERLYIASQWQLIWWKFLKHRVAVFSGIAIIVLYLLAIFAPFITPYDPYRRSSSFIYAPPQLLNFSDENGFSLRPFVYAITQQIDRKTLQYTYTEDRSKRYYVRFLMPGDKYKVLGLIESDVHLFGVDKGATLYLFGTDALGRDLFTRTIFGAQLSLSIGLVGVFISLSLGLVLGGISGFYGGWADTLIQRFAEIMRAFPAIPLWMTLGAALPPQWPPEWVYFGITVILSFRGWTDLARVARSKILALKNEDFVIAARFAGAKTNRIIGRHLIPSFMSHIIAAVTLAIPGMILGETSLSFLGLGLRSPAISWGVLLQDSQNVFAISNAPWMMIPGAFVVIAVLAFNFLGDGLRDAADPYTALT